MIFDDLDMSLTEEEIEGIANELSLTFPVDLISLYLNYNGGDPQKYVFENRDLGINTTVNGTLSLKSNQGRDTSVQNYLLLVKEKKLFSDNYFPFAVDSGGDYFVVDCNSKNADVYFFDTKSYPNIEMKNLGVGLNAFLETLKSEDE